MTTSSRYIQVSSDGFGPSRWTLNHSVTVWPLKAVRLAVTWVQIPLLSFSLNSVDSALPLLLRTCPSIQSRRQARVAPQARSAVWGWYQKDRVEVPVVGTVMVWDSVLSPRGSRPVATPSWAEPVPLCAIAAGFGALMPPAVQDVSADSNPPLVTMDVAGAAGVTGDDATEAAEVPMALVAETLNVYAAPLTSPVTVATVAGAVTWTGVLAAVPAYGVTV